MGLPDSAIYWYDLAFSKDSSDYTHIFSYADYLSQFPKKSKQSINWYNRAFQLINGSANAKSKGHIFNNLGVIYCREKSTIEIGYKYLHSAIQIRDSLKNINTKDISLSFHWFESVGNLYIFLNRYSHFDRAIKIIDTTNIIAINNTAKSWIKIQPNGVTLASLARALGNLSYFNILTGHFKEAEEIANFGIAIDPSQSWIETNLAHSLYFQGKTDNAKLLYKKLSKNLFKQGLLDDLKLFQDKGIKNYNLEEVKDLINEN